MADLPAWIFTLLCLAGFLMFAGFNNWIAWGQFCAREWRPSYAPLAGGACGVGAVLAAPLGAWFDRLPYAVLPLLLDFGSLPYLALFLWVMIKRRGPERVYTLAEYRAKRDEHNRSPEP